MSRFKPIRPVRVSDEVFEQLKQSILLGHFKAGERLPTERDLAEEFQVSRVAVREALRNLENTGFVSTRQGATGGAFVTELDLRPSGPILPGTCSWPKRSLIPDWYQGPAAWSSPQWPAGGTPNMSIRTYAQTAVRRPWKPRRRPSRPNAGGGRGPENGRPLSFWPRCAGTDFLRPWSVL